MNKNLNNQEQTTETKENHNDNLLLCTFVDSHLVDKKIEIIKEKFELDSDIFVLKLKPRDNESILTYNIVEDVNYNDKISHTINLHRKKRTNTLFTINALNRVIVMENGEMDEGYVIDWDKYDNSLLIIGSNEELQVIPTELDKIVSVEEDDNEDNLY